MRMPMKRPTLTCSPVGDSALAITVAGVADTSMLARVRALAAALAHIQLPGVTDIAPAYNGVTLYYDPAAVAGEGSIPYHRLCEAAMRCAEDAGVRARRLPRRAVEDRLIEIPVCYGGEFGPDLTDVARHTGLTEAQVIFRHSAVEYTVQAIGFSPGFPYLSGLPSSLQTPRRTTPREFVAAGSVGIGGAQTGVYPISTPGGWNLIGRTPSALFTPGEEFPALLRVGDRVRFRPISVQEFAEWK